jgi:hypothetical protein
MELIKAYFSEFVGLLNEMSPYLLLGFFFAGLLHVVMPNKKVVKYLGESNTKSVVNAALLGVPLPLCSCGVIPTGLSFYKNGASKGSAVSFLISTPQTGIDSIMVTYSMMGLPFALLRPVIAFFTGIAGGIFTNRISKNDTIEDKFVSQNVNNTDKRNPVVEIFRYAFVEFIQDIAKWLVIGIVIAAFISVIIPDGFLTAYLGNPFLSMIIVLIASIPLYVCATGSVPIAAVLIMKGLSPGAAFVFLMAGPATNAATITMVGKVMGRKALYGYLGSIICGALIFGLIIDYILPVSWFSMMTHFHHNHEGILPLWLQIASTITLGLLLLNVFRMRYFTKSKNETTNIIPAMDIKTINVQGMTCNHCKANVENGIRGIKGIKDVNIDLQQGKVTISADNINLELVKSIVEGLGYKYAGEI